MRAWRPASCALRLRKVSRPYSAATTLRYPLQKPKAIAELLHKNEASDDVQIDGWVRSVRKQKRVAFIALGDGSAIDPLQAVLKPEQAAELSHGTAVRLRGSWEPSQGGKQSFELQTKEVAIQGANDAESNPLQPKFQTAEYLRTIPHLRPRIPANALLLRLRSQVIASLTRWFGEQDFVQTHTPIITSSDCEGAGEVFTISSNASKDSPQKSEPEDQAQVEHFFRSPKYTTVSSQLHLEALAQAVNRVWTLSPTFRAEKSDTARHLSEFYMLEAEQCFVSDLNAVMDVVEGMMRAVVNDLTASKLSQELLRAREASAKETDTDDHVATNVANLEERWQGIVSADAWPRITYSEAINELNKAGFSLAYESGLETEHERWIAQHLGQGRPVFVRNYPAIQKPFYMLPNASGGRIRGTDTVACFDLLVPDLAELVGGSLREHRPRELLEAMQKKGLAGGNLDWYHDLRKYGSVPHGGFGLGFDRLLCYLSGVGNIRDVVAFPRWYGRCEC